MDARIKFVCRNENEQEIITLNLTYVAEINPEIIVAQAITTLLDGSTSFWRVGEERWRIRVGGYCNSLLTIQDIRRAAGWPGELTILDVCHPSNMTAVITDFRYNTWKCYSSPFWYRFNIIFEQLKY